jgi:ABC-2 type transport system permease protein
VIGSLSTLLGGVFYPVSALPEWLQGIARFLPITYGLEAMREVLLKGATLRTVLPDLVTLIFFASILIPVSLFCFKKAVARAKREGSLLQY